MCLSLVSLFLTISHVGIRGAQLWSEISASKASEKHPHKVVNIK